MKLPDWWKHDKPYRIGDCMELMKEIPDRSVDLAITDPPYNVGKDYGEYQDDRNNEEYLRFIREIIQEMQRVSRNGIGVYVYGALLRTIWNMIPRAECIIIYTKAVCWKKPPLSLYQHYHAILTTAPVINGKTVKNLWDDITVKGEGYLFDEEIVKEHPCQTSLKATERFIECFSNQEAVIIDPFLGSGTTLLACRKTGRIGLGFEINPEYAPIIETRSMAKIPDLFTFGGG